MSDNGHELACSCAPELLVELHEAASGVTKNEFLTYGQWSRVHRAVRACAAIIEELRSGHVVLVPAERGDNENPNWPPGPAKHPDTGAERPTSNPAPLSGNDLRQAQSLRDTEA